jgi:alkylhydroperoxidase family enzyme
LTDKRVAMLEYVEKLTVTPWDVSGGDVNLLREVGFTDRDVLDICEVAAYYAYVNRIADGLGVKLETWIANES